MTITPKHNVEKVWRQSKLKGYGQIADQPGGAIKAEAKLIQLCFFGIVTLKKFGPSEKGLVSATIYRKKQVHIALKLQAL
jgi:hypothetical protein